MDFGGGDGDDSGERGGGFLLATTSARCRGSRD